MGAGRWIGLGCGGSLLTLLALVGGGWAWVQSDAGERVVGDELEQVLRGLLESGDIEVGSLELKGFRLALRDVRVDGAEHEDVLVLPEVRARLDPEQLLKKRIVVEDVSIVQPRLILPRREDGGLDLPTFASSGEDDAPPSWMAAGWTLAMEGIRLEDGSIALPNDEVALFDVELGADLTSTEAWLQVDGLALKARAQQPELGVVDVAGTVRMERADLADLQLTLENGSARTELVASWSDLLGAERGPLQVEAGVDLPLADLERIAGALELELPEQVRLEEGFRVGLDGGGPLEDLAFGLTLDALDDSPAERWVTVGGRGRAAADWSFDLDVVAPDLGRLPRSWVPVDRGLASVPVRVAQEGEQIRVDGEARLAGVAMDGAVSVGWAEGRFAGPVSPALDLDVDLAVSNVWAAGTGGFAGSFAGRVGTESIRGGGALHSRSVGPAEVRYGVVYDLAGPVRVDPLVVELPGEVTLSAVEPVRARVADGGLRDLDLVLTDGEGEARVAVQAPELSGDRQVASVQIEALPVGTVASLGAGWSGQEAPPVRGTLAGTAELALAGAQPRVDLALEATGVVWDEATTATDLTVEAHLADGALRSTLLARGEEAGTLVDGSVDLTGLDGFGGDCETGLDTRVEIPELAWAELRSRLPLPEQDPSTRLGGVLKADGPLCDPGWDLAGSAETVLAGDRVRVELTVDDREGAHQAKVAAELEVEERHLASVQASADHPGVQAVLAAEDPTSGLLDWTVDAQIVDGELEPLLESFGGRVEGSLAARGHGIVPERTSGKLTWIDPALADQQLGGAELTWDTEDGDLRADLVASVDGEQDVEAHAEVGLDALVRDPAQAEILARVPATELPLAIVGPFSLGYLDAREGTLQVEAEVDGRLGSPVASGRVEITDGDVVALQTGVLYEDIDLTAALQDDRIAVDGRFLSRPRYGRFGKRSARPTTLGGEIVLRKDLGISPELQLSTEGLWVMATNAIVLEVGGDLSTRRPDTTLEVSGDLQVVEGRFDLDRHLFIPSGSVTLDDDIVFADPPPPEVFEGEDDDGVALQDAVSLDIDVSVPRTVDVKADIPLAADAGAVGELGDLSLDARVEGDLSVSGGLEHPEGVGQLEASGEAKLLTADLGIEQGDIAFTGGSLYAPVFTIQLSRDTGDGKVGATVRGTPDDLAITDFSSDQGLSDADILSRFMFGRSLSGLGESSSTGAASVQRALFAMAGNRVEDALGVSVADSVSFDPDDGLAVGYQAGRDAFVTVKLDPTADQNENSTAVQLSWFLSRDLEIEVETGDAGETETWLLVEERF